MSLDACIFAATPQATAGRKADTPLTMDDVNKAAVHWWYRGDWQLHNWMKSLYLRRGGGDRHFNDPCNVVLVEDDLDRLVLEIPSMDRDVAIMRPVLRDGAVLVYCPSY